MKNKKRTNSGNKTNKWLLVLSVVLKVIDIIMQFTSD